MRYVTLSRIEGDQAFLRIAPGHSEMVGFFTEVRLQQVSDLLMPITGKRLRVSLEAGNTQNADDFDAGSQPGSPASPGSAGNSSAAVDRRKAMSLPLVKNVFEVFSDATLIDVRPERQPIAPADVPPADAAMDDDLLEDELDESDDD